MPKGNEATRFKKGNRLSVGGPGRQPPSLITQELISQINEIDRTTGKEKKHMLVAALLKLALGYKYKRKVVSKDGRIISFEDEMQPDITAIAEVFDRVEGKARQAITMSGDENNPLRIITDDAASFTSAILEITAGSGTASDPFRNEGDDKGRPEVALAVLGKT